MLKEGDLEGEEDPFGDYGSEVGDQ